MRARFLFALLLAFLPVFIAAPAQADDPFVWENSPIGVYLPPGVTFTAVHGWYGAPDDPNCGADVSEVLTALAVGRNSFQVDASNSVFGDPCGGVYKVLRITGVEATFTQLPEVSPTETPSPTPSPTLEPIVLPTVEPSPEPIAPVVEQPIISEPVAPAPAPAPAPTPEPVAPTPEPTPQPAPPTPAPTPASPQPPTATTPPAVVIVAPPAPAEPSVSPPSPLVPIGDLVKQDPQTLTVAEIAQITEAATATLATEPQGSPAYNQALDQLMVVAQADDPQVPTEIASIPLLGNAAVAVLDAFNQLGNFGSDISPKVRKQAKKEAIATIAVGTATTAVAASGSVGYRRKETK